MYFSAPSVRVAPVEFFSPGVAARPASDLRTAAVSGFVAASFAAALLAFGEVSDDRPMPVELGFCWGCSAESDEVRLSATDGCALKAREARRSAPVNAAPPPKRDLAIQSVLLSEKTFGASRESLEDSTSGSRRPTKDLSVGVGLTPCCGDAERVK
jgi:hypothetical protein